MKNKFISKLLSLIVVTFILSISLVSCSNNNTIREETSLATKESTETIEWAAPPLVKINGKVYQNYYDNITQTIPPTGTIEIVKSGYPTENNEANFGEEGMEYWLIDDRVYIKLGDEIIFCVPESEIP